MPKLGILILSFILIPFLSCMANPTKDINMRFKDMRHGLSHQTVNCFYQDEFGFLWIGTQNGLNRFDGLKFDVYRPDRTNPYSININNIRQICGNGKGLLFISGLQGITLYDMHLNRFKMLRVGKIAGMFYANGILWIATGKNIYQYRNLTQPPQLFYSFANIHSDDIQINSLMVCKNQKVIVGTSSHGIFCINSFKRIDKHIDVGAVNSLTEDKSGRIWVATRNKGLARLDTDGKITSYRYQPGSSNTINHDNVKKIIQVSQNLFYIGTYAGLQTLNLSTGQFTDCIYDLNIGAVNTRSIMSMFYDRSGTLWLGTFFQGLQYYNVANDAYQFYRSSTIVGGRLNSYIISSIEEDNTGRIWLGSEGGGLVYLDKSSNRFIPFKQISSKGEPTKLVKSLYYERNTHCLWVASLYRGISRINLKTGRIDHVSEAIYDKQGKVIDKAFNLVRMIRFEGTDSLLVASKEGLLVLDEKRLKLHHFDMRPFKSKAITQVWDMTFDKDGELWLATSFELIRINLRRGLLKSYTYANIAHSSVQYYINHILCDAEGRIWLGSSGSGIYLFQKKRNTFIEYGLKQGLEDGYITGLVESKLDGSIYVATNSGLSKFNLKTCTFENYSKQSDFPLNNVNDGGLFISSDHNIYVCGFAGMISIAQKELNKLSVNYHVYVKRMWVNNMEVQPRDKLGLLDNSLLYEHRIVLPPRYSSVTFEIASNALNNITNVGLEYQLEGFDSNYIKAGGNTLITYTNLHPGHYIFHVRGDQRRIHNQDVPYTSIELIVEAPIYQRLWFILLVILIIASGVGYTIRMFWIRKSLQHSLLAEKREKEYKDSVNQSKLRFFTNVSHEFRTPLTLISSQLELLLMHKGIIPEIYNKILDIYKNTSRMNNLVDEVIDIRKQDQGFLKLKISKEDIVSLVKEICNSFYGYAQINHIDFQFNTELDKASLYIDKVQMEKVFYNLLSNAFKFTQSGDWIQVNISAKGENDIIISVDNKGVGIDPSKIEHVFERFWQDESAKTVRQVSGSGIGLSMAKGIVELHHGEIEVKSEPHQVTSFTVTLHRDANAMVADMKNEEELSNQNDYELQDITDIVKPDKSVKILIVEDNAEMRNVLAEIFKQIYEVETAANGQEGLDKAVMLQPQIIVSDIMMPVMSGLEMCEKLKSDMQTSHIPIVLLTARSREEHMLEGLQTGADDYISKPFSIKILVVRCHNIIMTRRLLQQRFAQSDKTITEELSINPIDKKILNDATAIVEAHINNINFDITLFSREICMSRTLLFTKLKALTGQTPNEFILSIRLKKACEALKKNPAALISNIAFDYGFSTPSYFIRCFKSVYGITPAAYRRNNIK